MLRDIMAKLEAAVVSELNLDADAVAAAAKALSLAFTSSRDALPSNYIDDEETLRAYATAFLLPNAAKVAHVIMQLSDQGLLSGGSDLNILDLGAGPGTATLSTALTISHLQKGLHTGFVALDRSSTALNLAQRIFNRISSAGQTLETHVAAIEEIESLPQINPSTPRPKGRGMLRVDTERRLNPPLKGRVWRSRSIKSRRFDLILAANVINEFDSTESAYRMACILLDKLLADGGAIVIIDPALRKTARPLMQLRDQLLADGAACVLAPCLHQEHCPMLAANGRDWCHFYIDWERPRLIERIDTLGNMDHRHLKMSYLVLCQSRQSCHCEEAEGRRSNLPDSRGLLRFARNDTGTLWRTVSAPIVSKGKRELWLCGSNGELRHVRRTDSNASDANRDLGIVKRGDVVQCADTDRLRKNDRFSIIREWK